FMTAGKVADPTLGTAMSHELGLEIDYLLGYKMNDELSLLLGYSQMFGTTTLQAITGGSRKANSNWAFIMLTFKPKIFNSVNYMLKRKEAAKKAG
ncbi:MAG: hypothetical protein JKX84_11625, partial [Flavobacteriales bacterium]|nr:hypothetical protein [Flavobacteriales bacterium]